MGLSIGCGIAAGHPIVAGELGTTGDTGEPSSSGTTMTPLPSTTADETTVTTSSSIDASTTALSDSTGQVPQGSTGDSGELPPDGLLLEAEDGVLTLPMETFSDAQASQAQYVMAPGGPGELLPEASTTLIADIAEPGEYDLYARVWAGDESSNSFSLFMNGVTAHDRWHLGQEYGQWRVLFVCRLRDTVPAGPLEITVRAREANTRLDYLLLLAAAGDAPGVARCEHAG